jgi:hypothetical protein
MSAVYRIDGYTTVSWRKMPPDCGYFCGRCRRPAEWERRKLIVAKTKASLTQSYFCEKHKPL